MIRDLKNCIIKIKDGTAVTPLELTVKIGEGTVSHTTTTNIEYLMDRGKLDDVRLGDEVPLEVSVDSRFDYVKGKSGAISVEDALRGINSASAWVSTDTDACRPYAVDLVVEFTPTCDTQEIETLTFPDFRVETCNYDHKAGTLSFSGKCNVTQPTSVRTAQD